VSTPRRCGGPLVEAKDNSHGVGDGMQQGLDYAATLDIPFVFSSNGDGFVFHDRTGADGATETDLTLDAFPSPADLWGALSRLEGPDTGSRTDSPSGLLRSGCC
jgi:type I restriction enzyme R subunit